MHEHAPDNQPLKSPALHPKLPKKSGSLVRKGVAQFSGQAFGLVLALFVSHLIARRMGVGGEADAFILGRRLITAVTETLNQVVGIVFIPLVAAQTAAGVGIWSIVKRSAGPAFLVGLILAIIFAASASSIVAIVAAKLDPVTQNLAAKIIVALSLALPATVATMALAAYCNVKGIFGTPAAIKQLPRAAVAIALILAVQGSAGISAAWSYTAASFGVVGVTLVLIVYLSAKSPDPAPQSAKPSGPATMRRSTAALILAIGALAFLWIETYVAASLGSGSVATLDFGQRLGALLGNTLATALGLVVFADLSRKAALGEIEGLGTSFQRALVIGVALAIPVAVGVGVNASALVDLILGYGAFHEDGQRDEVVFLVQLMAVAPVAALAFRMMLARIIADSALPMVRLLAVVMSIELVARVTLFSILTTWFGLAGIALTLILAPMFPIAALIYLLRGQRVFSSEKRSLMAMRPIVMVSVATVCALIAGAMIAPIITPDLGSKTSAIVKLALSGGMGSFVIGAAVLVFKVRPRLS